MAVYETVADRENTTARTDTDVNVIKEKKLSTTYETTGKARTRTSMPMAPPAPFDDQTAMEWIDADELVEVTPDAVRVRKAILPINLRPRRSEAIEDAQSVG